MAVTQKDVADKAGVTRAVVSKVMHGGGGTIRVNPETADRVRKVAIMLGYQPNAFARNFRSQRTRQIGLLHGDGFPMLKFDGVTNYFASLMDGIVEGAFKHGYTLGLCPDLFGPTPESALGDGRFDGFIWYSTYPSEANFERLRGCESPIVLIHSRAATFGNRVPTVICDNDQGIRLALEHLADLGHRRVSFLYDGFDTFTESRIRCDAFLSNCRRMGLDSKLVDAHEAPCGTRQRLAGLGAYFANCPNETALIAHSDEYGVDAMRIAEGAGLRVPQDFSVVGFDSTSACNYQTPPLTAVAQPLVQIGEVAVDLLVEFMEGRLPDPPERVLPCRLDVRGSTGPLRSASR